MTSGKLVVISGPSGVGKGTVIKTLLKNHPNVVQQPVTVTTRPPRPGEVKDKTHIFVNEDEFSKRARKGDFLEYSEYDRHRYGTLRQNVAEALAAAEDVILEVDVNGAKTIKRNFAKVLLIFISPPNFAELEHRLRSRHTEGEYDIELRLSKAKSEMEVGREEFDHIVINPTDHPEKAVAEIEKILNLS